MSLGFDDYVSRDAVALADLVRKREIVRATQGNAG